MAIRKQEIMQIRAEINEIKNRKTIMKLKADYLKNINNCKTSHNTNRGKREKTQITT